MMSELNIEDCSWNVAAYKRQVDEGLTEDQFIDLALQEGKYRIFDEADRISLLKMVYQKIMDCGCA